MQKKTTQNEVCENVALLEIELHHFHTTKKNLKHVLKNGQRRRRHYLREAQQSVFASYLC